jgi:hypothetical protein
LLKESLVSEIYISPQVWRIAAHEARRKAELSEDPEEQRVLLNIADQYDWLVEHGSKRLISTLVASTAGLANSCHLYPCT